MGIVARCTPWLLAFACMDCGAPPNAVIVNDYGDAGPGNCNSTCTLRDAITVALASVPIKGVLFSAAAGWPQTITLTQGQLAISNLSADAFVISGPGPANLAISAANSSRVFDVSSGSFYLDALTVRDGRVVGAPASPGDFESGENGDSVTVVTMGGCMRIGAGVTAEFDRVDVRYCAVVGGKGGNGGSGVLTFSVGGTGGSGGGGGQAAGGGIYTAGNLMLRHSSVTLSTSTGGAGGAGGEGGGGFIQGPGGNGGAGWLGTGGAVYVADGGMLLLQNSTLAVATATGGNGGAGGAGGLTGGNGGAGGDSFGALLHTQGSTGTPGLAAVEFSTLAKGLAVPGPAGPGGLPNGGGNTGGSVHGSAIWGGGSATVLSSIVVGGVVAFPLCALNVAAAPGSVNIDGDSTCGGFTLHKTFAEILRDVDPAVTPSPAYLPVYHGSAIDAAAACTGIGGSEVFADDQHATARPQGGACDLGAVEADYVFVDGFGVP